jgi:hypothetical protein
VFVNRRCLGETHRNTGRSSPMAASFKSLRYYCNAQLPCLHLLMALAALLLVSFSIYLPYNNTFLLDEYYDGNGLRELTRQDKLTIRYAIVTYLNHHRFMNLLGFKFLRKIFLKLKSLLNITRCAPVSMRSRSSSLRSILRSIRVLNSSTSIHILLLHLLRQR